MTYTIVWRNEARRTLSRLRVEDAASAKHLTSRVRALASDTYPKASNQLGGSGFWRLRLAELRVVCEVDEPGNAVHIYSIGRVQPPSAR